METNAIRETESDSDSESDLIQLQQLITDHQNKQIYPCTFEGCKKSYLFPKCLKRHIKHEHEFKCSVQNCKKIFGKFSELLNHEQTDHTSDDRIRRSKIAALNFIKNNAENKPGYESKFDDNSCNLKQKPLENGCNNTGSDNNSCNLKQKPLENGCNDTESDNSCNLKQKPLENGCNDTKLENPKETQVDDKSKKKYKCHFPGCNAEFIRPFRLENHLNQHTNKRPYKCTFEGCDKSYTNSSHLKRHSQTHSKTAKMFQCKICSVNIGTLSNFKRHYRRVHNPEKELHCFECNVSFRKKNRYEEHIAAHNNSSLYKCNKCEKSFTTSNLFQKHQRYCSKVHKCTIENCSKIFESTATLYMHKKTDHNIEYPCEQCGKVFTFKSELKNHTQIHSNDRPSIPCPYDNCNRLYYFKRNLNQHIRNNHIGKKFHCDICDLKLSTKQKIEEHIIKIHIEGRKPCIRKAPAQRIDTGMAKRSVLTKLTGIKLPVNVELKLMKRNPTALLRDQIVSENSFLEDNRTLDISIKGA